MLTPRTNIQTEVSIPLPSEFFIGSVQRVWWHLDNNFRIRWINHSFAWIFDYLGMLSTCIEWIFFWWLRILIHTCSYHINSQYSRLYRLIISHCVHLWRFRRTLMDYRWFSSLLMRNSIHANTTFSVYISILHQLIFSNDIMQIFENEL
jgi:hypothetical protein